MARCGLAPRSPLDKHRSVNALCESFFATLECELLDRITFPTPLNARAAVFDFIEGWYNTQRRHSALAYDSPLHFEQRHRPQAMPEAPMEAAGLWTPRTRPQVPWETGSARFPQLPQGLLHLYRTRCDRKR